ncbi:F510_1955 family glycosylhydrolase [Neobacillus sp. Marseille-QA0830]
MKFHLRAVFMASLIGLVLISSGCSSSDSKSKPEAGKETKTVNKTFDIVEAKSIKLSRIFGIGYPGNDEALYVAANNGIKMYQQGSWSETTANLHQYMGFQAIDSGFIASGHPQKGSDLKDPLGIVLSEDKGKTLEKLSFYGNDNFNFLGAGYQNDSLYLISDQEKQGLAYGVNYSVDNGASWKQSQLDGFKADSFGMLAVHPQNGNIMAMSTRTGIYYSLDNGNTTRLITDPVMVTALTFSGDSILYSSVENEKILLKTLNPETGEQAVLPIPFLDYDNAVTYCTVNPKNPNQLAFSTYKNDLYESTDGGQTWVILLKEGKEQD